MTRRPLPPLPVAALRSHASPARVERVWRRLELDLAGAPVRRARLQWWSPAAALGIFALGVLVGVRVAVPHAEEAAIAEPQRAIAPPGAAPVAEREVEAAARPDAPPPKLPRARPLSSSSALAVEEYPVDYAEPAPVVSEPLPVVVDAAEWERLAEAGDFRAARAALERTSGFDVALVRASAAQLLVLADIARSDGSREQALRALKRVLTSYVFAPEAPVAAWTLGNLLEQSGDRVGAADAYATYRRLSPAGDFAEDAAARQVDVALSQGNLELAGRAMDEYAQNFPKGRRLAELRKRFTALTAPPAADGAAVSDPPEEDDEAAEPAGDVPGAAPAAAREH
ncbi:MAG TPA: hypothetical protein VIW29_04665 [Polyangiaceae bacterium]